MRIDPRRLALRACRQAVWVVRRVRPDPGRFESRPSWLPGPGKARATCRVGRVFPRPARGTGGSREDQGSRRRRRNRRNHLHGKREARGVNEIRIDPRRLALRACRQAVWVVRRVRPDPGRFESRPCMAARAREGPGHLTEWAGRSHARPGAQVDLGRSGIQAKTTEPQKWSARQARSARRGTRFGLIRGGCALRACRQAVWVARRVRPDPQLVRERPSWLPGPGKAQATCRVGRVFLRPAWGAGGSRGDRDPGEDDGTAEIICTASAKRAA